MSTNLGQIEDTNYRAGNIVCLFVLTDGQEMQIEVASLTRERPIGWDIPRSRPRTYPQSLLRG